MNLTKGLQNRLGAKIAIIAWSLWVVLDYVVHHPYLTKSLTTLPYLELLLPGLVIGGAAGFLVHKRIKGSENRTYTTSYRGIWVFLLVQVLAAILIVAFSANAFMPKLASSMRVGFFFYMGTSYFLGLLVLVVAAFAAGNAGWSYLFKTKESGSLVPKNELVKIAVGFSLLGTLFVIIGQLGLFKIYVLWPILLLVIGWQWKASWHFARNLIWTSKPLEIRSWWVPLVLLLLVSTVAFNWLAAFKVFPIGFDGSSLYANLAMLVAGNGYLPAGGQAYNWSVIMGLGQALYDDVVFAILLSHLMNVFCLLMLYRLARLWLSGDVALLASAVFLLSPYVAFHGIIDEKVDLALAFMVLASFYPLAAHTRNADEGNAPVSFPISILILSGWLTGYAFGIKYTAIMYLLALAAWFFYFSKGTLAFLAAFLTIASFVFLAEIYRFGYLDIYTSEARMLGGLLGMIGLGLFYYAYRSDLKRLLIPVKQLAILGGVFVLPFVFCLRWHH